MQQHESPLLRVPLAVRPYALYLWERYWRQGLDCWLSQAVLADGLGTTPRRVRIWESALVAAGVVLRTEKRGMSRSLAASPALRAYLGNGVLRDQPTPVATDRGTPVARDLRSPETPVARDRGPLSPATATPVARDLRAPESTSRALSPPAPASPPPPSKEKKTPEPNWAKDACTDWDEFFGKGSVMAGKVCATLKPIVTEHGWGNLRPAWRRYLEANRGKSWAGAAHFREHLGQWYTNGHSKPDQPKHPPTPAWAGKPFLMRNDKGEVFEVGGR